MVVGLPGGRRTVRIRTSAGDSERIRPRNVAPLVRMIWSIGQAVAPGGAGWAAASDASRSTGSIRDIGEVLCQPRGGDSVIVEDRGPRRKW